MQKIWKTFRAGRAGSHLPEFFRSVAEGSSRKKTPGVQTVSGKIRSNPEKRRNDRVKTDNRALFDFALEEVEAAGWTLKEKTFDLHADARLNEGNVMTEYEERFSAQGNPICKYIISR